MTDRMQTVQGRCPACGTTLLFLDDGGHVTCSLDVCPNPSAADDLLHGSQTRALEQARADVAELGRSVVEWADLAKRHQHWGQRRWNAWKSARGRAQRLAAELAALRQVARGYCPTCGRGDAAPTVEDWEQQRQRAATAEQHLRAAEFTARHWHQALIDDIPAAHAIACIRAAVGGRADPNRLGLDEAVHDAFHDALDERAPATAATGHVYLSTGCLHGKHDYCQSHTGLSGAKKAAVCKWCEAPCRCSCHREQPDA